jgi:glycosyltransferase involved in cell wall biosynthesis
MQVIVTSFCRLKYLKQTVESLRQDEIQLFISDGGSDDETKYYIEQVSDGHLFFEDNPGADHLKTEGIKKFVTDKEFMISSDDLRYPAGYSKLIMDNYRAVNDRRLAWTFMACNMPMIEGNNQSWKLVNGIAVLETAVSQVAGAILDTEVCRNVGYFPVYGRSGQGDWAISKRIRAKGYSIGYWRQPIIEHIGQTKWEDFPEYSAKFKADEDEWISKAQFDTLRDKL